MLPPDGNDGGDQADQEQGEVGPPTFLMYSSYTYVHYACEFPANFDEGNGRALRVQIIRRRKSQCVRK